MSEPILWSQSGIAIRTAVVELCGWCNNKGHATPTGQQIAHTEWTQLTPAAKTVLQRHGIQP